MPSASQRFSQRETVSGWRGRSKRSRAVTAGGTPDAMSRNAAVRSRNRAWGRDRAGLRGPPAPRRTREGSGVPASQPPEQGLTRMDISITEYFFKVHQPHGKLSYRLSPLASRLSPLASRLSAISYRLSAIDYRFSAIGYQLSAIASRLSPLGYQLSTIGYRLSPLASRLSAISYRLSAIDYRFSAIGY
jgi:hypothetical protein